MHLLDFCRKLAHGLQRPLPVFCRFVGWALLARRRHEEEGKGEKQGGKRKSGNY